ncbi:MAG: response regulator transcription factor [Gemmatimonadota bacterium]
MTEDALVAMVDDDPIVLRALARLIGSVGLRVETFPSAQAFLDYRLPDRPACLVLDVQLPGRSGLELQAFLTQAGRDIPIVFITGRGDVPTSVNAMKGGAVDFLQKPFEDQALLDAVFRALDRSRERIAERSGRADIERRLASLTPREREVLPLVVAGMLNKQIASALGAAEKTVKVHRGRIMVKMEANSVADLVRMAEKLGIGAASRP